MPPYLSLREQKAIITEKRRRKRERAKRIANGEEVSEEEVEEEVEVVEEVVEELMEITDEIRNRAEYQGRNYSDKQLRRYEKLRLRREEKIRCVCTFGVCELVDLSTVKYNFDIFHSLPFRRIFHALRLVSETKPTGRRSESETRS